MDQREVLPHDFNPWLATDALKGITEAIHWFVTEGPGAEHPMPAGAQSSLIGLTWAGRNLARQLHAYFAALEAAGIELPGTESREVREPSANYLVN